MKGCEIIAEAKPLAWTAAMSMIAILDPAPQTLFNLMLFHLTLVLMSAHQQSLPTDLVFPEDHQTAPLLLLLELILPDSNPPVQAEDLECNQDHR